jgi:hypothetical protein
MSRFAPTATLVLATMAASAQTPQVSPHAGYVYPAGGRQGTEFEVTVGGRFLDGASGAYFSGAGVRATVISHVKPSTPIELNQLREKLKELMARRPATAEDQKAAAEVRDKIAALVVRPATPAIGETVTLKVTVAPDAAPGPRELRLATTLGLTNPLPFSVGQLPEVTKAPAKVRSELPALNALRLRGQTNPAAAVPPVSISLPVILNGQIAPGGVDRYRFSAAQGQRLVVRAAARELIPYISDAVPGWFQATLALYDAQGREVAYDDDYRFHPDPVLFYEVPADGEYVLEIKDSLYRGREDFVYRITAGELPFVTFIFPLGGKAGSRTTIEWKGWNLAAARTTQDLRNKAPGLYPLSARAGEWISNRVPFVVDCLPERAEREPNDGPKNALRVKLPIIVNGRVDRPGDVDLVRFQGRAGEEIVAEVTARRLDSPLDSVLKLTDSTGKQLAANDDFEDKGAGLVTHQADSRISFKLPQNGTYYVHLADAQRKGGGEYAYRLRISRPRPDFELRVVPASVNARPGSAVPMTVYALRRDGFAGDIALRLKDAPPGFALSGGWVPGNQDKIRLTVLIPPRPIDEPGELYLEGRATIQGREVRRLGVPAEDMMQAFAFHHLVPAQEWLVRVSGPVRFRAPSEIAPAIPVKLPSGGTATVKLLLPLGRQADQLRLALNEPPDGITIEKVAPALDGVSFLLRADAARAKPGLKGNLIVDAFLERPAAAGTKQGGMRRLLWGTLPAIPFEVVRR